MKKYLTVLVIFFVSSEAIMAQGVNINGYGNYVFDDKFDSYYSASSYYEGKILGGFQWGVGIEYKVRPEYGIELVYLRQDTKAPMTYYANGVKVGDFDLGLNWVMLGGVRYMTNNPKVHPYGGFMLGACFGDVTNPESGKSDGFTKFAWGIRLGANINASEKFGIKLQTQLMSAVQSVGGSVYFGTGGAGAGVASYSTMLQFGLGGGIFYRINTGTTTGTTQPK